MDVLCVATAFCCDGENRETLQAASQEGKDVAQEIIDLSETAYGKGERAIEETRGIEDNLSSFGIIDASTFVKIKELEISRSY